MIDVNFHGNINSIVSVTKDEFKKFVYEGNYTDQDVIDLHEAVLHLYNQLEQAQEIINEQKEFMEIQGNIKFDKTLEIQKLKEDKQKLIEACEISLYGAEGDYMLAKPAIQKVLMQVLKEVKGSN